LSAYFFALNLPYLLGNLHYQFLDYRYSYMAVITIAVSALLIPALNRFTTFYKRAYRKLLLFAVSLILIDGLVTGSDYCYWTLYRNTNGFELSTLRQVIELAFWTTLIFVIVHFLRNHPIDRSVPDPKDRVGVALHDAINILKDSPTLPAQPPAKNATTASPTIGIPVSPIPTLSDVPLTTQLKLKRSQRSGMMGKIIFILDARMELSPDDAALVAKYRLGERIVYESSTRQKRAEATKAHLESTREHPSLFSSPTKQALGVGKTLFRLARAGTSAAMTALALRITIDSLAQGVHVECKSLEELTEAENAIVEAARNLKGYLASAVGFDGQEEIVAL
jgi:hypothetical protein